MSKELEALEEIKEKYKDDTGLQRRLSIIKEALEDQEKLQEANFIFLGGRCSGKTNAIYSRAKIVVQLNALEIIRKKRVNVSLLIYSNNLSEYNKGKSIGLYLSQQEYNLLREVLL